MGTSGQKERQQGIGQTTRDPVYALRTRQHTSERGTSDRTAPRAQQQSIEERSDGLRQLERGTSGKHV